MQGCGVVESCRLRTCHEVGDNTPDELKGGTGVIENATGSDNEKSGSNAEKTRKGGDKEKPAASYKEKHPTGIPSSSSSSNKYGFYQSSCSCYGFAVAQNKETNKSLGERENQGQKQDTC
jgi:hypothetical protein